MDAKKIGIRFGLPALVLLGCAGTVTLMMGSSSQEQTTQTQEKSWFVNTTEIKKGNYFPDQVLMGKVVAKDLSIIYPQLSAQIESINVQSGDWVEKNQVIMQLKDLDAKQQWANAQADAKNTHAQLVQYKNNIPVIKAQQVLAQNQANAQDRQWLQQQELYKQNLISTANYEEAQLSYLQTQLQLQQANNAVQNITVQLDQLNAQHQSAQTSLIKAKKILEGTQIIAPFSGRITQLDYFIGSWVNPNQAITRIYNPENMQIKTTLPLNIVQSIHLGELTKSDIKGSSVDQGVNLTLSSVNSELTQGYASVDALFDVTQGPKKLSPGQSLQFVINNKAVENSYQIPNNALFDGNRIYQIIDSRLSSAQVNIAGRTNDHIIITSSQELDGNPILTSRISKAANGLLVTTEQTTNENKDKQLALVEGVDND